MSTNFAAVLRSARVIGILRAATPANAVQAGLAAARGGLRAIELTFSTPNVGAALLELRSHLPSDVLLGVGTVLNASQLEQAVAARADFLVSPHLDVRLVRMALDAGVPYAPGVLTPSEIVTALESGAQVVKIFPVSAVGGAAYLRDLHGPLPHLPAMVTGGVAPSEVSAYLQAGAIAVGLGGKLFPQFALEQCDWPAIETATRAALLVAQ